MDTDDPFARFGMGGSGMGGFSRSFSSGMGGMGSHSSVVKKQQDPPVIHDLQVTLEEVLSGCTKKMKISRKRLNPNGQTTRTEEKILEVQIKKGWKEGTKITFPKEGDETPRNIPADVVFMLKDKQHPVFKRDGSDIIYTAKISLRDVSSIHSHLLSLNTVGCCQHTHEINKVPVIFLIYFFLSSVQPGVVWLHSQRTHAGGQISDGVNDRHRAARHEMAY